MWLICSLGGTIFNMRSDSSEIRGKEEGRSGRWLIWAASVYLLFPHENLNKVAPLDMNICILAFSASGELPHPGGLTCKNIAVDVWSKYPVVPKCPGCNRNNKTSHLWNIFFNNYTVFQEYTHWFNAFPTLFPCSSNPIENFFPVSIKVTHRVSVC